MYIDNINIFAGNEEELESLKWRVGQSEIIEGINNQLRKK